MVDQALERLNERSLLGFSLDGQTVSVHRLAARVIRAGLARQGRLVRACRAAASAVEGSVAALAKHPDHAAVMEMLGQVAALAENAGAAADDADEQLPTMLTRLRSLALNHLVELGDTMPHAIAIGEPLIADLDRLLGPDDPDTVRARNDLARAYRETGRVADAIPLVEQVLAARERLFGAERSQDPRVAEQSRQRLPGYRPGRRCHRIVRGEPGRVRAALRCRSPQDPGLAAQSRPRPPGVGASRTAGTVDHRLPRRACSRSIASNSALKLPLPNPCEPCRSISSKKTVGRSCTGWVKICSR